MFGRREVLCAPAVTPAAAAWASKVLRVNTVILLSRRRKDVHARAGQGDSVRGRVTGVIAQKFHTPVESRLQKRSLTVAPRF